MQNAQPSAAFSIPAGKGLRGALLRLTEEGALLVFSGQLIVHLLQRTTMAVNWPYGIPRLLFAAAAVLAALRTALTCRSLPGLAARAVTLLLFLWAGKDADHLPMAEYALVMLSLADVPWRRILAVYAVTVGCLLALLTLAACRGVIPDLVYQRKGRLRHSFGMRYPTYFAAHAFFICLCAGCLRGGRITAPEVLLMAAGGLLVWRLCDARADAVCILLSALLFAAARFRGFRRAALPVLLLGVASVVCILLLSRFYRPDSPLMSGINRLLSGRLQLGRTGFSRYPVSLRGTRVVMRGFNGFSLTSRVQDYFAIDGAWLLILLQYGVLLFIWVLFLLLRVGRASLRTGSHALTAALALTLIQGTVEFFILEMNGSPLPMLAFASLVPAGEEEAHARPPFRPRSLLIPLGTVLLSAALLAAKGGLDSVPYYMEIDGTQQVLALRQGESCRQFFYAPRPFVGAELRLKPAEGPGTTLTLRILSAESGEELARADADTSHVKEDGWLRVMFPGLRTRMAERYCLEVTAAQGDCSRLLLASGGSRYMDGLFRGADGKTAESLSLEFAPMAEHNRPALALFMALTVLSLLLVLFLFWHGRLSPVNARVCAAMTAVLAFALLYAYSLRIR